MVACAVVCAGDLKYPVGVQVLGKIPDGSGGYVQDWSDVFTINCKIKQSGGKEQFKHEAIEASAPVKFWTNYTSDINETHRLVFRGKNYNIRYLDDIESDMRWLEIGTERGAMD